MKARLISIALSLLILGATLSSPRVSAGEASTPQQACVGWDLTYANWLYQASAGGYGTISLTQDTDGRLTGSYWNEAVQGGGTLTGHIEGTSLGMHSSAGEWLQGSVSPAGTHMGGTLEDVSYKGTWEADGVAACLAHQPEPPEGSASCEVAWGQYRFNGCTATEPVLATQETQQATGTVTITSPGPVVLAIRARFFGQNLPTTVTVVILVGTEETVIGTLTRVSQDGNSAIYRGTVTVPGTGLSPGRSRLSRVRLIDPADPNRRVPVIIVSQFLIDPAGNIYDADSDEIIEGATVTCYQKQGEDWVIWPAESFSQTNPLVSDDAGHYAWMTDPGDFRVKATMPGYLDAWGGPVTVPPEVTDLHIYLEPTTAAAPEAADLWISDRRGLSKTAYLAGEHLQVHLTISNTESSDVDATLSWTTTGPDGQIVGSLSGSDSYTLGPFTVDPKIPITVPPTAAEGWYTLRTELTYQGQTRFLGTQFLVEGAYPLFLPLGVRGFGAERPGWNAILAEDFEGAWPGPWDVSTDPQSGDYAWGKRNCRAYQGANAAWAVGGGSDGSALGCGANYPNGVRSWLVYGPFSLENVTAADLSFQLWLRSEPGYDEVFWGASLDNSDFFGEYQSGDSGGWQQKTLDLANVPTLGSLLGQQKVWIGLVFLSDSGNTVPEGAHVDDVLLRKFIDASQALGMRAPSATFGAGVMVEGVSQPARRSRAGD